MPMSIRKVELHKFTAPKESDQPLMDGAKVDVARLVSLIDEVQLKGKLSYTSIMLIVYGGTSLKNRLYQGRVSLRTMRKVEQKLLDFLGGRGWIND